MSNGMVARSTVDPRADSLEVTVEIRLHNPPQVTGQRTVIHRGVIAERLHQAAIDLDAQRDPPVLHRPILGLGVLNVA